MPPGTGTDCTFRLVLTGPARQAELGRDVLARCLGLSSAEAARRLGQAPSVLANALAPDAAKRLTQVLRLLGVPVRCEAAEAEAQTEGETPCELAILPTAGAPAPMLAARLAVRLDRSVADVLAALQAPGGLVLDDMRAADVAGWRASRDLARALILVSHPEDARYDLLPWFRPQDSACAAGLSRHLRALGLVRCPLTGAVAAGVDCATSRHILARFPAAGLLAVNRDFQRFDLVMTAASGLGPRELADFLATRKRQAQALPAGACPAAPEVIDRALTRTRALAFQAEYALIGIETGLRLMTGLRDRD